ncbi:MAG: NYN domain-containing protein [Ruminococcus sp.]|nr:NYN domain-containing protein [Ruminococcus sp.]
MQVDTMDIVATTAYLIGVRKSAWEKQFSESCPQLLKELDGKRESRIIRSLCKIRTTLMQKFKHTDNEIRYEMKNLDTLPQWYDVDDIRQLMRWDVPIILVNTRAQEYSIHINDLISRHIDACKGLYPEWIKWEYIRDLFVIPKYTSTTIMKHEFAKYMEKIQMYPYQVYMHWKPQEVGNLFHTDGKFLSLLYDMHGDYFDDRSKFRDAAEETKNNIYDFINRSYRTVLVVDCENSDVYKLYSVLKNLNSDEINKIGKIILYDDQHTTNGWDYLEKMISIPVEHIEVDRVTDHKSLVDMKVATGVCQEFYRNDVDSFILLSSDSDYWGLISSLPEAKFLVMHEYAKLGHAIREKFEEHETPNCSIDDFCTGNIEDLKRIVLINELRAYLPEILQHNGKELAVQLFEQARIEASENEINNFYNRYIKTLRLKIDNDGNFSIEVNY